MRAITWGPDGPGELRDALRLPNGSVLTASSAGVVAWDPTTEGVRATWDVEPASALALSPDGDRVAVMRDAAALTIHDLEGAEVTRLRRPEGEGGQLRWDALLVVCNQEGLWGLDPGTGKLLERWDAGETWMLAAAGGRVLHGSSECALRFERGTEGGTKVRRGEITSVALLADGRCAVAVGRGVRTYDATLVESGRRTLAGPAHALHLTEDGTLHAVLEDRRFVRGDAKPVKLPGSLAGENLPAWRFDRDGDHLLMWSAYLGVVEVIDLANGALVGTISSFGETTSSLEIAHDRVLVLSSQADGQNSHESASLFDAHSGKCLARVARRALPGRVAVDRRRGVIVHAGDEAVELTQATTGERVAALEYPGSDDLEELVVIGVAERADGVVIELEDQMLLVDVNAMALVASPARRGRGRR